MNFLLAQNFSPTSASSGLQLLVCALDHHPDQSLRCVRCYARRLGASRRNAHAKAQAALGPGLTTDIARDCAAIGSPLSFFFVPDNNHTTQENTGGVWFFIVATPKHLEECGSLLWQRPNTKSWSAIIQRSELNRRTSSSKQNFPVSNQNAHFSEPYNSETAGQ